MPPFPRCRANVCKLGSTCYAIVAGERLVGTTSQTITASREGRRPTWDVVVHQKLTNGSFDLRDHFVLDRKSLLPTRMDSQHMLARTDRGWQRVSLNYTRDRVRGMKETADETVDIDTPLAGPTWDGNLWGVTFAALPLKEGGTYSVPFWQYDKGFGTFTVRVVGSNDVVTPTGTLAAWAIEAGDDPARPVRYLVAKVGPRELGYSSARGGQRLVRTCG